MRRLTTRAPGLLALALLLTACSTQTPGGSDGSDGSDQPGQTIAQENGPWQGSWETVKAKLDSEGAPSVMWILHRGQHLSVSAIRVEGTLALPLPMPPAPPPPPLPPVGSSIVRSPPVRYAAGRLTVVDADRALKTRASLGPASRLPTTPTSCAAALIVVEGQGTLDTRGEQQALRPGSIALLPAGQGGAIHAPEGGFYGLVIGAVGSEATGGRATVVGVEDALPGSLIDNAGGNHAHTVGSVPGALTVRTLAISGTVKRHVHLAHDEFVFLIRGWGTMGMGSEGSARHFVSYPMRERSLALIPAHSPHSYANESDPRVEIFKTLSISVHGPSLDPADEDSYRVE